MREPETERGGFCDCLLVIGGVVWNCGCVSDPREETVVRSVAMRGRDALRVKSNFSRPVPLLRVTLHLINTRVKSNFSRPVPSTPRHTPP